MFGRHGNHVVARRFGRYGGGQAGGGSAAGRTAGTGGGAYPYPLLAEVASGSGRVLGIALDLNDFAGMRDRDLFVRNTITYLVRASRMGPAR